MELSALSLDDLLDEIEELDPGDEFIAREVTAIPRSAYTALATETDALIEAAWHARNAFEKISDALARGASGHDERLGFDLIDVLAPLGKALMGDDGTLVDLGASCSEVAAAILADEDYSHPRVILPTRDAPDRAALRRYRLHGCRPHLCALDDDWPLRGAAVVLARVGDDADRALDELDQLVLQLPPNTTAVVVGPATLLIDPVTGDARGVRDRMLRERVIRAAVRLPAGLTRGGSRSQLAIWVLTRPLAESSATLAADLSGIPFTRVIAQQLLDDLLAAAEESRGHAYALLHAANFARIVAENLSLTAAPRRTVALPRTDAAADDAVRILRLRESLMEPAPDPFPFRPDLGTDNTPGELSLGDAVQAGTVKLLSGTRLDRLPQGSMRLWTAECLRTSTPTSVDRLALMRTAPRFRMTEPMDVVFSTQGRPCAVVDVEGAAAVAYPARVIRARDPRVHPSAIAAAINALPEDQRVWRTWPVPLSAINHEMADAVLQQLDSCTADLRRRQTELEELRRLVTRSVLTGAVQPVRAHHPTTKGQ
ncbi:hypothetical protein [Mariniluteicoccus endophyticus]